MSNAHTPAPVASTVLDSILFRDAFGTPRMRGIFCGRSLIARCIEVEIALARAEARCGVIPAEAADEIGRRSTIARIDSEQMRAETDIVGYPILPLVHQLVAMCGDAGRYVHWGATTQDIMDTAVVLQIRDALSVIDADIAELRRILADLAVRHRDTPMAGRTHLQHALPVTFGYKVSIWLAMFDRHAQRLAELRPRVLVGQFGGAAGTLASLGDRGLDVQRALMEVLDLGVPATTWHVARDGLAETVNLLALVTGSLGKIAYDVMLMASTEFGELYEPFVSGRGASSTMPQKRNPISSELKLAASKAAVHRPAAGARHRLRGMPDVERRGHGARRCAGRIGRGNETSRPRSAAAPDRPGSLPRHVGADGRSRGGAVPRRCMIRTRRRSLGPYTRCPMEPE